MRLPRNLAAIGLAVAVLLLGACGVGRDPLVPPSSATSSRPAGGGGPYVVGSADLTESEIVAEIYAQALQAKGVQSSTKLGIGSREEYLRALQEASIQIVPEYTGNLLLEFEPDSTAKSKEDVEGALPEALPDGLEVLKSAAAVNQDVYVVTKEFSERNGVTTLADLAKITDGVTVAGFADLGDRSFGPEGLTATYEIKVKELKPFDSPEQIAEELKNGTVDVADLFTTDSAIGRNQLVQLADPKQLILPQNVVPLVRSEVADSSTASAALNAVQEALTTEDLIALNSKVDDDRQEPAQVARDWLTSKGLV